MYISETKYEGRPASPEGRLPKELACYDLLDRLGIFYERVDHDHADTIGICEQVEKVLGRRICKNLFLCNRQKTAFYLLMMPGDKVFKTKELSAQINSARLSFGPPEEMKELLDITPGSVSILGLMNDHGNRVQLLVDEDVLKGEYVGCHPCINTSSLKIRTEDIFGKFLKAVRHDAVRVRLTGE